MTPDSSGFTLSQNADFFSTLTTHPEALRAWRAAQRDEPYGKTHVSPSLDAKASFLFANAHKIAITHVVRMAEREGFEPSDPV